MKNWNQDEINVARSRGGVLATTHPFDNLIRTGCVPWPPAEITQKLYQSRQVRAFSGEEARACKSGLGYYCDLQSLHSEDAITWSVFGTAARAAPDGLQTWLADLFQLLSLHSTKTAKAEVFLWRRLPHPDNLAPGGPEIDAGIVTENSVLLFEAKWRSSVGAKQGVKRDKDQIQLRGEFLAKYGSKFFPDRTELAVIGVGLKAGAFKDTTPAGIAFRSVTWKEICELPSHPHADELGRYFRWKLAQLK